MRSAMRASRAFLSFSYSASRAAEEERGLKRGLVEKRADGRWADAGGRAAGVLARRSAGVPLSLGDFFAFFGVAPPAGSTVTFANGGRPSHLFRGWPAGDAWGRSLCIGLGGANVGR